MTNCLEILGRGAVINVPPDCNLKNIFDQPTAKPKCETASTITVTIKDDEKTLNAKYLMYQDYSVDVNDPIISSCIAQTLKSFEGEPNEVRVRINLSL
jgi:hypothetical protein